MRNSRKSEKEAKFKRSSGWTRSVLPGVRKARVSGTRWCLIFQGCITNYPQTSWLKTTRTYYLVVLEGWDGLAGRTELGASLWGGCQVASQGRLHLEAQLHLENLTTGELPELLAGASPRWFSVRGTLECVHVLATARWLGKERKKEAERKKNAEDRPEADFPVIYNLMTEGPQHCAPCHRPYRPTWLNGPGDQAEDARGRRGPGGISASQGPATSADSRWPRRAGHRWTNTSAAVHVCESHWVVSNFLRPQGLYSPRNSPGQKTRVGSLSLLQGYCVWKAAKTQVSFES